MQYISDLPLSEIKKLMEFANKKEYDEATFDMWLSLFPYMQMGHCQNLSYGEFKNTVKGHTQNTDNNDYKTTNKSKDDIVNEMIKVVKIHRGKGVN